MANIAELFDSFQRDIEKEQETKEKVWIIVREIDLAGRQIFKVLQIIHQTTDKDKLTASVKQCRELLNTAVQPAYAKLEALLTPVAIAPFYQFHEQWRNATQKLTFLVTLMIFLEDGSFALHETVAKNLNMKTGNEGLALDLEDYLAGLLTLASELSRYAVNSVTHGDYERPLQISKFVAELAAGFRLLTFKNDFLRKKYDALKYDVKKIEEVVYDLSIRGISSPN